MPAKGSRATGGATKMTQSDASRIQSAQAKSGGDTGKSGFAARAQAGAARNANAGANAGATGAKGGKGAKSAS